MDQRGDMFRAESGGQIICYYVQLEPDRFLIVLPKTLSTDPIDCRYSIISGQRFRNLTKGYVLQQPIGRAATQ